MYLFNTYIYNFSIYSQYDKKCNSNDNDGIQWQQCRYTVAVPAFLSYLPWMLEGGLVS